MSIILNNALNNALEAAVKCSEDNRFISIKSYRNKNAFMITVRNSCSGNCIFKDGELPETTKANRAEHGFGLANIKNTVEKYCWSA